MKALKHTRLPCAGWMKKFRFLLFYLLFKATKLKEPQTSSDRDTVGNSSES